MDFFQAVNSRVSIRAYKNDTVPMETVKKVIEAASRAPSWANKQCWRFVVIDSKVEKNLIGKASGQANIAKACEDAPFVIVICTNPKESSVRNGMEYFMFDCGLAAANLIAAAQAEGLATCLVGWFDEKTIRSVLNMPDDYRIVAFTPLGFAAESISPRSRKELREVVYYNQWNKPL